MLNLHVFGDCTALLRGLVRVALCAGVIHAGTGCAEPVAVNNPTLDTPRFLRYTLRSQQAGLDQQAYRSNYLSFAVGFKAGSKVTFPFYSSQRVDLKFNGVICHMYFRDLPFPTEPEKLKKFIEKHFAMTEEELNLGALDKARRDQIDRGTPAIGMTKEQVFLALGYPSHVGSNWQVADDLTQAEIFQQSVWRYRYNEIMMIPTWYSFLFSDDGVLVNRDPP